MFEKCHDLLEQVSTSLVNICMVCKGDVHLSTTLKDMLLKQASSVQKGETFVYIKMEEC